MENKILYKIPKSIENETVFKQFFENNIYKIAKLLSYYRFYPDAYLDSFQAIQPDNAVGFKLRPYQRMMLRTLAREDKTYFCMTRSSAKTFIHILFMYIKAMTHPNIQLTIFSSTIDQAVRVWKSKHKELIRFFPLFSDAYEGGMAKFSFQKDKATAVFNNGSQIQVLAMSLTSLGERSNVLGLEEANLLNNDVYINVIEPIALFKRTLPDGMFDIMEKSQIHRFTTSGFAGSSEFNNIIDINKGMAKNSGSFVFGTDWRLPYFVGWLSKKEIDDARAKNEAAFRQNYLCEWIGCVEGAFIDINKLLNNRNLLYNDLFDYTKIKQKQYVISSDISASGSANSIIIVAEVNRKKNGELEDVRFVEINTMPRETAPSDKAKIIKKVWKKWGGDFDQTKSSVQQIIIDSQTIGSATVQELLKNTTIEGYPEDTKNSFDFSTDKPEGVPGQCEEKNSPKIIYCMNATKYNSTDVHLAFKNLFDMNKVKLIATFDKIREGLIKEYFNKKNDEDIDLADVYKIKLPISLDEVKIQCEQIETLIRETSNLKAVIQDEGNRIIIKKNTKTIEKDRFSAAEYLLYYVNKFMSSKEPDKNSNLMDYIIGGSSIGSGRFNNKPSVNGFGGFKYSGRR